MPCSLQKWPVDGATDLFGQIVSSNNRILCYNIDLLCQVEPYNIQLLCSWYILDSWVVSHLALNICILCLVWLWVQALVMTNSFSDTSKTSMFSSWFYLVYLIWYYYLSVKFVMWIVKMKIENKRNLLKKIMSFQIPDCFSDSFKFILLRMKMVFIIWAKPSHFLFIFVLFLNAIHSTKFDCIQVLMVCLGFKPKTPGWQT